MAGKRRLDLSTFDRRLLDGLNFCKKVYDMFDQVRGSADGIAKIDPNASYEERKAINGRTDSNCSICTGPVKSRSSDQGALA